MQKLFDLSMAYIPIYQSMMGCQAGFDLPRHKLSKTFSSGKELLINFDKLQFQKVQNKRIIWTTNLCLFYMALNIQSLMPKSPLIFLI